MLDNLVGTNYIYMVKKKGLIILKYFCFLSTFFLSLLKVENPMPKSCRIYRTKSRFRRKQYLTDLRKKEVYRIEISQKTNKSVSFFYVLNFTCKYVLFDLATESISSRAYANSEVYLKCIEERERSVFGVDKSVNHHPLQKSFLQQSR